MAGDWIKFEICTPDKAEVWQIADTLSIDPDAVVGKLLRVWTWFDQQTENGNAPSVTKKLLDRSVGVLGFCDACIFAGWMTDDGTTLAIPRFDRHNGKTAKNRALTAKRVAKHKAKNGNEEVTHDALPREEKRRALPPNPLNGENADKRKNAEKWEPPPNLNTAAWAEFEQHRREIREPLTNQARTKNANILVRYPQDTQQAMGDRTIANRWKGVFPPDGKSAQQQQPEQSRPSLRML